MPAPLAVIARGLSKTYAGAEVKALDSFDLEVATGEVVGLLGPNGSGKTTAVRILSTTLRPDEGSATVLGHDVAQDPEGVRRVIGLAGQYATVDENLTGAENLEMVAKLCHLPRREVSPRATELLGQFGLSDAGGRPVKTYSGGMRRRLDLAAALVARPPLLFLDEPTTGLDPQSRLALWEVIEALVEGGTTVLLTTQYLEEADRLASTIVVLNHGQVIANDTPAALKADLGATALEVTLGSKESARAVAAMLTDLTAKAPHQEGAVVEIIVEDGPLIAAEALRRIDASEYELLGLSLREPSLDDVFLALTGQRTDVDTESLVASQVDAHHTRRGSRDQKEES